MKGKNICWKNYENNRSGFEGYAFYYLQFSAEKLPNHTDVEERDLVCWVRSIIVLFLFLLCLFPEWLVVFNKLYFARFYYSTAVTVCQEIRFETITLQICKRTDLNE